MNALAVVILAASVQLGVTPEPKRLPLVSLVVNCAEHEGVRVRTIGWLIEDDHGDRALCMNRESPQDSRTCFEIRRPNWGVLTKHGEEYEALMSTANDALILGVVNCRRDDDWFEELFFHYSGVITVDTIYDLKDRRSWRHGEGMLPKRQP